MSSRIIRRVFVFFAVVCLTVAAFAEDEIAAEGSVVFVQSDIQENVTDFESIREAVEQGIAEAQYDCGKCLLYGWGVEKDEAEAVKWFRKAAEQGLPQALNELGACYFDGKGVTQDEAEAVKWFRKAAEQGDAGAQLNLGLCYRQGRGVEKNDAEAVKWYRKAAEQGLAQAQTNLAIAISTAKA